MWVKGCSFVLCLLLALGAPCHGQSQSGFISIDCGAAAGYTDPMTNITYSPDDAYVVGGAGESLIVSSAFSTAGPYSSLRSFPVGTRNCYALSPVQQGNKYLVRAGFLYGNYDSRNQTPAFDLHLGVNLWKPVTTSASVYPVREEIISVAMDDGPISVCLVNTGLGTPFVSLLELRPLPDAIYGIVNGSRPLSLHNNRKDMAKLGDDNGNETRYPDDVYDRLWFPSMNRTDWERIATSSPVANPRGDLFQTPPAVLMTATTVLSESFDFHLLAGVGDELYVAMHFAELEQLPANETREFEVYLNGSLWHEAFSPAYLVGGHAAGLAPRGHQLFSFSLRPTARSTRPPILNGLEVYAWKVFDAVPTDRGDVGVMTRIKELYSVGKNWVGDPCVPQNLTWDGVSCSYEASPRIISLNLTASGLTGEIPNLISNLTAIKSLDLSHNDLTGGIPDFLAELQSLHVLDLSSNQLTGIVPSLICKKSLNGSLILSIDDNTNLSYTTDSCQRKEKKKILLPIAIAASVIVVVFIAIAALTWIMKKRRIMSILGRKSQQSLVNSQEEVTFSHILKHGLKSKCCYFTFQVIENITSNFERELGKGGYGTVFHGCLEDKTEVAVKMFSKTSSQGTKEFHAEVLTLTMVHHKNLVLLLGYCDEKNNPALVYEYMSQGSLLEHLRGKYSHRDGLNWRERLRIAHEAAQGLEYLHNGCKPPIVHRDVKTANILLNKKMEAKIADFGLSRVFKDDEHTHTVTAVAGTLGYLDPEYYRTLRLNEKSDVYSFGIVILELITGKPPIFNYETAMKIHIVQWVKPIIETGDVEKVVDPKLQGDYDVYSIWRALEIAMLCTTPIPTRRATMTDVVTQLKECLTPFADPEEIDTDISIKMIPLDPDSTVGPSTR